MIRIIACVLIFLICGALGILKAGEFSSRVRELEDLKIIFGALETEMRYRRDSLPQVLERLGKHENSMCADFFRRASENLHDHRGTDLQTCWERTADEVYTESNLKKKDLEIVKELGLQLGKSDIEGQKAMFRLFETRLEHQLAEAVKEKREKGKMYRSLGFAVGAALAIIII